MLKLRQDHIRKSRQGLGICSLRRQYCCEPWREAVLLVFFYVGEGQESPARLLHELVLDRSRSSYCYASSASVLFVEASEGIALDKTLKLVRCCALEIHFSFFKKLNKIETKICERWSGCGKGQEPLPESLGYTAKFPIPVAAFPCAKRFFINLNAVCWFAQGR